MSDRENVAQFRTTMQRAYKQQKALGKVNKEHTGKLDRLFAMNTGERVVDRGGRVLFFWRTFRRRVAIMYAREHRKRVVFQLDWQAIWQWIVDNWQAILRTILFLVPFII